LCCDLLRGHVQRGMNSFKATPRVRDLCQGHWERNVTYIKELAGRRDHLRAHTQQGIFQLRCRAQPSKGQSGAARPQRPRAMQGCRARQPCNMASVRGLYAVRLLQPGRWATTASHASCFGRVVVHTRPSRSLTLPAYFASPAALLTPSALASPADLLTPSAIALPATLSSPATSVAANGQVF